MVPGPRLLLSLLLLAACPAEQLGVELPRGGPASISQEDLQRDAWMLSQAPSLPEAAGALARRMGEMRMVPGFSRAWVQGAGDALAACARKDGAQADAVLVVAVGDPEQARGAVAWAGLVSLAKGSDVPGVPERTLLLCAVRDEAGLAALLAAPPQPLERVHRSVLVEGLDGEVTVQAGTPDFPDFPDARWASGSAAPAALGAVDYRQVEERVRALHAALADD